MEPHTRNVTRIFRWATPQEILTGIDWYVEADEICEVMAKDLGTTRSIAAGVIAATSPLMDWEHNVKLAWRVIEEGGLTAGYFGKQLAKADRILAGEDPALVLGGQKTTNFYQSILTRGEHGVCIDRHATDIAYGQLFVDATRPKADGKRYDTIAERYRRASSILSKENEITITPAQVQSITWTKWRTLKKTGALPAYYERSAA